MAKKFTNEELENIINDYDNGNGLKPYQLAEKYERSSASIINKLKSLNLYTNKNYRFTEEDINFLKEHYPYGEWDIIFKRFPNINKASIHSKMSKLGIKAINEDAWTEEEIKLLKENYSFGDIKKICELLPNRTYKAICTKAKRLGIKRRELYSKEELELLKYIYSKMPLDEVLTYFPNRSRNSIISQAMKLKIHSFNYNPWTEAEDRYITDNYELIPDIILANILNRTQRAVQARRLHLGLYRRDMDVATYETLSKYIRGNIQYWKTASMKKCDYKCIFTGSKEYQIHHLYGVSNILNDVMTKYHFNKYENLSDYTEKELNHILMAFIEEQNKYPLGVCISKDIHVLFHSLYGQYYNTPEQWYQFEKDFKAGIYNEMILNKIA